MVVKVDASFKEGLKERHKGAFQALQNKQGNAITACSLEGVRLSDNKNSSLEIDMGKGVLAGYRV
jgi:hypothetical protein